VFKNQGAARRRCLYAQGGVVGVQAQHVEIVQRVFALLRALG